MLDSSIRYDAARSYVTTQLARLERAPATPSALLQAFQIADLALSAVEIALDNRSPSLADVARRAYLTAVLLAKTIDRMPRSDADRVRFIAMRRTASSMLSLLERLVRPEDRELRARALGETAQVN